MANVDKNSIRQRIIALRKNDGATFPPEKYEYINSLVYKLTKTLNRTFTRRATPEGVRVTRIS